MCHQPDPGVLEGLSRAVGHGPPFSGADKSRVDMLHIANAKDFRELEGCSSLATLIVIGSDPVSLADFDELPLRFLTIMDSALDGVSEIERFGLLGLDVPRNRIRDIAPLGTGPNPKFIDVTGNPLSEQSYREVIPHLVSQGRRVRFSAELEWKVTARLHDAGIPVCCYVDNLGYRLCRPGLQLTELPQFAHPLVTEDDVRRLLDDDPRTVLDYFDRDDLIPFSGEN
jgi:hypothetical protein